MMRHALKKLGTNREETAIIGDRMDTDMIAGIESELDTVLVLSGVSTRETIEKFPYQPKYVLRDVGEIVGL
jgi:NagD protein